MSSGSDSRPKIINQMAEVDIDDIFNPSVKVTRIGDPRSQLWACGKNDNLELTIKGYKRVEYPSGVSLPKFVRIESVSSASNHSAIVTTKGHLYIWGSTLHGKLGIPSSNYTNVAFPTLFPLSKNRRVVQVVCGDYHTLCVFDNGEVYGWGGTLHKKIGDKTSAPSLIDGLEKVKVTRVDCGDFHSIALSENGILFSWGGGGANFNKGQCGHGTTENIRSPRPIEFFKNKPVRDFACGGYHTVAICENRELYSWGSGNFGELGTGAFGDSSTPKRIQIGRQMIIQIACGGHHTVLLTSEGKVLTCGNNNFGQTGHKSKQNIIVPTRVYNISNKFIKQIACGWNHTLAYVEPYYVYSTGLSKYGELGLGDLEMRKGFRLIEGLSGKNVKKIFGGGYHSWFLMDAGDPDVDYQIASPLLNTPLGEFADDEYEPNKRRRTDDPKEPKGFIIDNEEIVIGNEEDLDRLDDEPDPPEDEEPPMKPQVSLPKEPLHSYGTFGKTGERTPKRPPADVPDTPGKNYAVGRAFTLAGKNVNVSEPTRNFHDAEVDMEPEEDEPGPPNMQPSDPSKPWYAVGDSITPSPDQRSPEIVGTDPDRPRLNVGGPFGFPGKLIDEQPPGRPKKAVGIDADPPGRRSINESDDRSIHSEEGGYGKPPKNRPGDQPRSKTFLKSNVEKDDRRSTNQNDRDNDDGRRKRREIDDGDEPGSDNAWRRIKIPTLPSEGPASDRNNNRQGYNEPGDGKSRPYKQRARDNDQDSNQNSERNRDRNRLKDRDWDNDRGDDGRDRFGLPNYRSDHQPPTHNPMFNSAQPGFAFPGYQTGPWPQSTRDNSLTGGPDLNNMDFSRNPYGSAKVGPNSRNDNIPASKLRKQRSNDEDMALFENDNNQGSRDYTSDRDGARQQGSFNNGNRGGKGRPGAAARSDFEVAPPRSNGGSSVQGSRQGERSGRDSGRNAGGEIKRRIEIQESNSRQLDKTTLDFQLYYCDLRCCHRFAIISYRPQSENQVNSKLNEALRYLHDTDPKINVLQVKKTSDLYVMQNDTLKLLVESFQPDKNLTTVVAMMVSVPELFERKRAKEGFEPTDYTLFNKKKLSIGECYHLNANDVYSDERLTFLSKWYFVFREYVGGVAEGIRFVELRPSVYR